MKYFRKFSFSWCVYTLFCALFVVVFSACLLLHKNSRQNSGVKRRHLWQIFLRRRSKRQCSVSAAQNSFLPVAGATGSHYLTWMMLKQFGLRGERWFSKEKALEPSPQSQELQFAAGFFLHTAAPQRSRIVGRAAVTVSASTAGCRLGLGGKGFFFTLSLYFWGEINKIQIKSFF